MSLFVFFWRGEGSSSSSSTSSSKSGSESGRDCQRQFSVDECFFIRGGVPVPLPVPVGYTMVSSLFSNESEKQSFLLHLISRSVNDYPQSHLLRRSHLYRTAQVQVPSVSSCCLFVGHCAFPPCVQIERREIRKGRELVGPETMDREKNKSIEKHRPSESVEENCRTEETAPNAPIGDTESPPRRNQNR